MRFAEPLYLGLLAIVVPLALAGYVRYERARRQALAAFGAESLLAESSALPGRVDRAVAFALGVIGVALCLVALARPQLGAATELHRRSGGDVLFILDLSRSMNATDVPASRLDAAKHAAAAIARSLPDDRVGLLVFGGTGFLQLPPTADHSTFRTFLDATGTADIPDPSTNLEAAASVVAAAIGRAADAPYSAAVLLSDGEDTEGKLEQAIRVLHDAGVRVSTVGVGTIEGASIPDRDSSGAVTPHRDYLGRPVVSRLVEQNLRDIARRTGGVYVRWAGEETVGPVVADLTRLRTRAVSGTSRSTAAERYQWWLALAFCALLAESVVRAVRPRRLGWA
jgi:Ca-activated chloride channel family protein